MSGILRGSIEHRTTTGFGYSMRDVFAATVRFFDSHPAMTRIASYRGTTSGGTEYGAFGPTDANSIRGYSGSSQYSGEGAYGVWRWNRADGAIMYICVQWGGGAAFAAGKGAPGFLSYTYGVGIQIALDTSGGDCWNGDTANDGDDDKGGRFSGTPGVGPVWVANGGDLLVWPRANGIGGTYATNKQAFTCLYRRADTGILIARYSILADDDSIWAVVDPYYSSDYDLFYFGPYTPRTGITPTPNTAYVMWERCYSSSTIGWDTVCGTTSGNTTSEGGIAWNSGSSVSVRNVYLSSIYGLGGAFQPNQLVNEFDVMDIFLRTNDSASPPQMGLVGKIDPANLAFVQAGCEDANPTLTKAVFGPSALQHLKLLIPWDGATPPGIGAGQTGIQF